ncbi:hypothetical protein P12x_002713 [Tundrisphaera lichenicola]|uniref:hypothetical protein n=1 Tax=Tundrisphaera lichenicola TaxID=2029860 RepID=UPI003EBE4F95
MIRTLRPAVFALLIGFLATPSPALAAGPRPFHSRVVATWDNVYAAFGPSGANFIGYGQTTHLGRALQEGSLFLLGFPDANGEAPGIGSVTLTASNGDQLTFDYVGTLNAGTGVGAGTFQFTHGTGRFAGATGSGTFYAVIDLSNLAGGQAMTVVLDGTITY